MHTENTFYVDAILDFPLTAKKYIFPQLNCKTSIFNL